MKTFKSIVKQLLSKLGVFDFFVRLMYAHLSFYIYKFRYMGIKSSDKCFVFESFQGKNASDSPYALYLELKKEQPDYVFFWVFNDVECDDAVELAQDIRTKIIKRGSSDYFKAYASSKYWIVNCRIPYRLVPSKTQILVQCWHGTPLKKLGKDIQVENHPTTSLKAMHFAYQWEGKRCHYFLSPSEYASKCFKSAFGLKDKQILELGYPRNDELIHYRNDHKYLDRIKKSLNIDSDKKIILYAPTFRDDEFLSGKHVATNQLNNKEFKLAFSQDEVQFLFRGHYFTQVSQCKDNFFINVSAYPRINDLLLIADEVITDYSSLFFDYLILQRPMYFYMYDKKKYLNGLRGTYLDVERSMPGPIAETQGKLVDALKKTEKSIIDHENYCNIYNPHEDGGSSMRVIQIILGK